MLTVNYEPNTIIATNALPFNGGLVDFQGGTDFSAVNCIFKYGQARNGGAIYIKGQSGVQMTIAITGSNFNSNKAAINGGAIYIEDLDNHVAELTNLDFANNYGLKYGDNIYVRQASRLVNTNGVGRRLSQMVHTTGSSFKMKSITFNTPLTYNQIYVENVESVIMESLSFKSIVKVQAMEGAAIYMKNYLSAHIKDSTFPK